MAEQLKYTEEHEWLAADGDVVTIGITEYAASQLGDVVFVELPEVGATLAKGDDACVIESVKAASDILAPIDGEVIEVNEALNDNPGLVNEDPLGDGWFFRMKASDLTQLDDYMDEAAYKKLID